MAILEGRANKDSDAGKMPSAELLSAMGKYNEELRKAGVLLDVAGLQLIAPRAPGSSSPERSPPG